MGILLSGGIFRIIKYMDVKRWSDNFPWWYNVVYKINKLEFNVKYNKILNNLYYHNNCNKYYCEKCNIIRTNKLIINGISFDLKRCYNYYDNGKNFKIFNKLFNEEEEDEYDYRKFKFNKKMKERKEKKMVREEKMSGIKNLDNIEREEMRDSNRKENEKIEELSGNVEVIEVSN